MRFIGRYYGDTIPEQYSRFPRKICEKRGDLGWDPPAREKSAPEKNPRKSL